MTERYDAIVVGAGHNGLVCAAILARSGRRVLVLEAADQVGGAAVTREFAAGYSVSSCAHLLYQLQPQVIRELGLAPELVGEDLVTVALGATPVRITESGVDGVSDSDREQYADFQARSQKFARLLQNHLNRTPPRLGTRAPKDLIALARLGFDIRRLGKANMREFLRIIGMNIHDELDERFESGLLKGAISLDAVLGTHLGPRSPGTMLTWLYRLAGSGGRLSMPAGGMGSVAEAIAGKARDAGATIRSGMKVSRIVVDNGRVSGVESESGERFESLIVVSNADPKRTIIDLVGPRHVETGFMRRIRNLRCRGNAAKLHLALDRLPAFDGLEAPDFRGRLLIAPDEHYVERAFNPAKYGSYSTEPVIEMTFPSLADPSLAPPGRHVMSAIVQYAPYGLAEGWTIERRAIFEAHVMETIARYAPDIGERVTASELLTPADIEAQFGITGGHWHHGELALDQFLFTRPVVGAAQYRMPIDGLFLCGAGAHPGGGVSGAPGRNAARAILESTR